MSKNLPEVNREKSQEKEALKSACYIVKLFATHTCTWSLWITVHINLFLFPKDLSDYCKTEGAAPSESCVFLNLMISFLWREWRDAASTRRFFIKKLNLEFQELLLNKAAGKLLQQIQVKDYFLGDSLPTIKSMLYWYLYESKSLTVLMIKY